MMNRDRLVQLLVIVAALVLGSCNADNKVAGGGISGSGVNSGSGSGITSTGSISGFGSVIVNGVKFDSSAASVTIDGNANQQEASLKVGMVVTIKGTLNSDKVTGKAASIDYESEMSGAVDAAPVVTPAGGTFSVFGQVVVVDTTTLFENATKIADLSAGTTVEVSGFRDSSGRVLATRVEVKTSQSSLQVKGTISDVTVTSFTLGTITVNYAGAAQTNFPAGGLTNGLLVVVKATNPPVNNVLTATSVEVQRPGIDAEDKEKVEAEGLITNYAGGATFTVNGQPVSISSSTTYENGTAANLASNVKVSVEGVMSGGVLMATKVKFQSATNVGLKAQVTGIDPTGGSVTVFGSPGIVIKTTSTTQFRDSSAAQVRTFNLGNIGAGDRVSVQGTKDSANAIVAAQIERTDPDQNVSLKGLIDSAADPTIVILGISADTTNKTEFKDNNDNKINQTQFFNLVTPGKAVELEGTFSGATISVTEIKLEN